MTSEHLMTVVTRKHESFKGKDGELVEFTEVVVRDEEGEELFRLSRKGHSVLPEVGAEIKVVFHIRPSKAKARPEIGVIDF